MIDEILQAIDEELARLHQARALLLESGALPARKTASVAAVQGKKKARRELSPKARQAIAEAQRRRWAKVNSQKKAATPAAPTKKESAAS